MLAHGASRGLGGRGPRCSPEDGTSINLRLPSRCRPPGCGSRLPNTHGSRRGLASAALRAKEHSSNFSYEIAVLVTSLYVARLDNEVIRAAANTVCTELRRRLSGGLPTDCYFQQVTSLGDANAHGHFPDLNETPQAGLLMPYPNQC